MIGAIVITLGERTPEFPSSGKTSKNALLGLKQSFYSSHRNFSTAQHTRRGLPIKNLF